jgi:glutaredoxin
MVQIVLASQVSYRPMSASFTLYTRAGCHLCERVEDLVAVHAPECRLVDVDTAPNLQQAYGLRVPVFVCGDRVLLEGQIEERDLIQAIRQA